MESRQLDSNYNFHVYYDTQTSRSSVSLSIVYNKFEPSKDMVVCDTSSVDQCVIYIYDKECGTSIKNIKSGQKNSFFIVHSLGWDIMAQKKKGTFEYYIIVPRIRFGGDPNDTYTDDPRRN